MLIITSLLNWRMIPWSSISGVAQRLTSSSLNFRYQYLLLPDKLYMNFLSLQMETVLFSHELLFPWPCLMLWFFHSSSSSSFACRVSSDSFVLRAWCVWILSCELLDSFVGQWEVLLFCTKRLENLSVRSVCFGKFSIGFFGSSDLIISSPETFVRSLIFGGQW